MVTKRMHMRYIYFLLKNISNQALKMLCCPAVSLALEYMLGACPDPQCASCMNIVIFEHYPALVVTGMEAGNACLSCQVTSCTVLIPLFLKAVFYIILYSYCCYECLSSQN